MAASTLHTLLIKLGFDISSMKAEGTAAQQELEKIGQAARRAAAMASPATTTLQNLHKAAEAVAGSKGASVTLERLAQATDAVLVATKGSGNALNQFTAAAQKIGTATQSGTVLNNFSRAMMEITTATGGSVKAITDFSKGAVNAATGVNGSVAGLNRFMIATVDAAKNAGSAANAINVVSAAARGGAPSLAQAAAAGQAAAQGANAAGAAAGGAVPPIRNVGNAAQAAAGGMNSMGAAATKAAAAVQHVGVQADVAANRSSFLNRTLSMAFAFSGGVAVTTVFGFLLNAVGGFNSRLEQANIAFTTLLGNADKAEEFIGKMQDFAEITPFEYPELQDAVQRLMAMGYAAEDAIPILQVVGDTVSALGGNQANIERITRALGQMSTSGRVNAQDMRQLTEALVPAWQILAEKIGKTVEETRKLSEQGLIPANQAVTALLEGMNERFGGLMEKQARTAKGAFSTIKDSALQTISGAVKPLYDLVSQTLVNIADFFIHGGGTYVVPVIQAIGVAIGVFLIPRLFGLISTMEMATIAIRGMTISVFPLIVAVSAFALIWQEDMGGLRTTVGPAVGALVELGSAIASVVMDAALLLPVIEALVILISIRFVAGLAASAGAMIWNAGAAFALSGAFTGLTVTTGAATVAVTTFGAVTRALFTLVGGMAGVIGLWITAAVLLILNFDRVAQGVRVLALAFVGGIKTIVDAASNLPIVGEAFKGLQAGMQDVFDGIVRDMASAEADIARKAAEMGEGVDPMTNIDDWLKDFQTRLQNGTEGIVDETKSLVEQFGTTLAGVEDAAAGAGGEAMEKMAEEIRNHQNAPMEALQTLHDMVRNQLEPTVEIARLYGMLMSEDLAIGMASGDSAVRAQAEATKKIIEDRLNELTGNAYSIGVGTGTAYAQGVKESLEAAGYGVTGQGRGFGPPGAWAGELQKQKDAWDKLKPSVSAVEDAMADVNAELSKAAYNSGLSALNSAFNELKQSAHRYFDEVHKGNLKAIDDALKHKNALLDAKAALNQAPVTAAQKALDFQRQQIEEWRLREAIAKASSPEEYRDAVLALQDFLAQKHIDEMQAQVDAANEAIDIQKQANEDRAAAQREAENQRYEDQVESFDRQLELLRRYLEQHPGEWQNANEKVLALLRSYGITYKSAGSRLGAYFAEGLREQVNAVIEAAKEMADLIPDMFNVDVGGSGVGGEGGSGNTGEIHHLASGSWNILNDNVRALLHKGEMVAPAESASLLRALGSRKLEGAGVSSGARSTGGTLIVQIGEERVADIMDRNLAVNDDIYGGRRRISTGSQR